MEAGILSGPEKGLAGAETGDLRADSLFCKGRFRRAGDDGQGLSVVVTERDFYFHAVTPPVSPDSISIIILATKLPLSSPNSAQPLYFSAILLMIRVP